MEGVDGAGLGVEGLGVEGWRRSRCPAMLGNGGVIDMRTVLRWIELVVWSSLMALGLVSCGTQLVAWSL